MKRSLMIVFSFVLATLAVAQAAMHVLDIRHGLSESRIRKICQMPDGRIAIATTSTIDVFDGTRFSSYQLIPSYAYPLKSYHDKRQLTCDSCGRIWLRNDRKLFVVDTRSRTLVKDVKSLIEKLGLKDSDIATWRQVHSPHSYDSIKDISSIVRDSYGGLWLGTLESGIYYQNEKRDRQFITLDSAFSHKPLPLFSSSRTAALVSKYAQSATNCTMDSDDGYAWLGTLHGLMVFDKDDKLIATIDSRYGLSSDNVHSIFSDNYNNVWIVTAKGISRINILESERFRITNFGELDGIRLEGREFRPRQIFCDSAGQINVGFGGGTVCFIPDSVNAPRYSFIYPDPFIQNQNETEDASDNSSSMIIEVSSLLLLMISATGLFLLWRRRRNTEYEVIPQQSVDSASTHSFDGVSDDTINRLKTESERKDPDEEFMAKVKSIVENHIADEDFSVQTLSDCMAMDRTGLYRRLQSVTGKSPSVYIREIRLEVAARLLVESDMPVADIALNTGYSTTKYFNKVFKQAFAITPEEYRKNKLSPD